jgi:hypothetical protein
MINDWLDLGTFDRDSRQSTVGYRALEPMQVRWVRLVRRNLGH